MLRPRTGRYRRSVAVLVVVAVWGLITHGTFAGSGDEPHYLIAAQSLAFDWDLDVRNDYARPHNLIGGGVLSSESHARTGVGGVLRPAHDVGLPMLFAPYVRLVYPLALTLARMVPPDVLRRARLDDILIFRHLISLAMALLAAVLAVQLYMIVGRVARSEPGAAGWALLVALSPPLLAFAFLFFTELPSALLIVWLYRVLSEPDERPVPWFLAGAATGLLLLLHVRNAAAVLVLLVWGAVRLWRTRRTWRSWAAWGGAALLLFAVRTYMVHLFWGTFITTPLAVAGSPMTLPAMAREVGIRVSGLLADQEFGLWWYAPVYLLIGPALASGRGLRVPGGRWALAIAGAYVASIVLPQVNIHGWTGGWSPPARMITPVVPLLAVVIAGWAVQTRGAVRMLVTLVVACQIAADVILWQWPKAFWNYGDGQSAFFSWAPPLQRLLPAWNGTMPSPTSFAVVLGVWAAVSLLIVWMDARGGSRPA